MTILITNLHPSHITEIAQVFADTGSQYNRNRNGKGYDVLLCKANIVTGTGSRKIALESSNHNVPLVFIPEADFATITIW